MRPPKTKTCFQKKKGCCKKHPAISDRMRRRNGSTPHAQKSKSGREGGGNTLSNVVK
jgi:hypothetical protein